MLAAFVGAPLVAVAALVASVAVVCTAEADGVCTADVVCAAGVLLLHAVSSKPAAKHATTAAAVCRCGSVMAISLVDGWLDEQG